MLRLRIKEVAQEKGVSMTKLSHLSEVSYTIIRGVFKDPYQVITTYTLNRLANSLNVPPTALVEDVSAEQAAAEKAHIAQQEKNLDASEDNE